MAEGGFAESERHAMKHAEGEPREALRTAIAAELLRQLPDLVEVSW